MMLGPVSSVWTGLLIRFQTSNSRRGLPIPEGGGDSSHTTSQETKERKLSPDGEQSYPVKRQKRRESTSQLCIFSHSEQSVADTNNLVHYMCIYCCTTPCISQFVLTHGYWRGGGGYQIEWLRQPHQWGISLYHHFSKEETESLQRFSKMVIKCAISLAVPRASF